MQTTTKIVQALPVKNPNKPPRGVHGLSAADMEAWAGRKCYFRSATGLMCAAQEFDQTTLGGMRIFVSDFPRLGPGEVANIVTSVGLHKGRLMFQVF